MGVLPVVRRVNDNITTHAYLNHTWKPNYTRVHDEHIRQNPDFPEPYTIYHNN